MAGDLHVRAVLRRPGFALDVELDAPAGATTAVLGPNGAGKSTLLDVVCGLVLPDEGRVTLGGRVLTDVAAGVAVPPDRRGVGAVLQGGALFDHLDVRGNVAFGPRAAGVGRRSARARADRWLEALAQVEPPPRRPPGLSGGQAQRVALARALATEPDVLVLDEPLSALDVAGRDELRRVLVDHLAGVAGPRLLVTHDPEEASLLADVVQVVEAGRVTFRGTPDELRLAPPTAWTADLAGTNLLRGEARDGLVHVDRVRLVLGEPVDDGPVTLAVHPRAVALHRVRPGGSPRNAWLAEVVRVEDLGARRRVLLGGPVALTAEVTADSASELGLVAGAPVWAAVKATELRVTSRG